VPWFACLVAGGLGDLNYPLVADLKKEISEKYGVLTGEQQNSAVW
jgi:alkyl hydroperoxide reductase subunit AhpC